MAHDSVSSKWLGNMAFESVVSGHKIITDAGLKGGGEDLGPRPKKLMLLSLAGCTGVDVVTILKKMRVEFEGLTVTVEGDLTDEHPREYYQMHVIYEVTGKDLPLEKIQRAVEMSEEFYCGVSAVYKKALKMTSEIRIIEPGT